MLTVIMFLVGGLVGWVGGYCYGWLMGTKDTERRWSDAVGRGIHDAEMLSKSTHSAHSRTQSKPEPL